MSGERQFLLYGEDADPGPSLAFDRGITGQDKCSFRQIHFAGDSLHFYIVQTAAVGEDGKRIALERAEVNTSNWMKGRRREKKACALDS